MRYALTVTSPPAVEALTVAEAKAHLRIASDFTDDDTIIASYVKSAREWVEDTCGLAPITQTIALRYDCFPGQRQDGAVDSRWPYDPNDPARFAIEVPRYPLASVSSITYVDTDGTTQTLSSSLYDVDASSRPGRIAPAYGQVWPAVRQKMNPVVVTCVCGYGAAGSSVPENIRALIRLLVAHQYENREPVVIGTSVADLPMAVETLFWKVCVPKVHQAA